jgi:hypothetical protein
MASCHRLTVGSVTFGQFREQDHKLGMTYLCTCDSDSKWRGKKNNGELCTDYLCNLPCASKAVSYPRNAESPGSDHLREGISQNGAVKEDAVACAGFLSAIQGHLC